MNDDDFQVLFEALKILQKEDLKGKGAKDTIGVLINGFSDRFTEVQKGLLASEFHTERRAPEPARDVPRDVQSYF